MRPLLFVAAAVLVFAATIGSASAADPFATLEGVTAVTMTPAELAATKGRIINLSVMDAKGVNHFNEHIIATTELVQIVIVISGFNPGINLVGITHP